MNSNVLKKVPLGTAGIAVLDVVSSGSTEFHRIPVANAKATQELVDAINPEIITTSYKLGEEIVRDGSLLDSKLSKDSEFAYAQVPLGIITRGSVTVLHGGKAVKTLGIADFIGLFETSHWLLTKQSRQIGGWDLVAEEDTEILFFESDVLLSERPGAEAFRSYLIELARADHVPQPISTLPLLDWVASHTTRMRISDCAIVAHTHLLPNNLPFFRHLSHLVGPGRIFILEKPYSTVRSVFNDLVRSGYDVTQVQMEESLPYEFSTQKSIDLLWKKVVENQRKQGFKKLLIVDDGGDLWLSIPWKDLDGVEIVGVEQTQRGIVRIKNNNVRIPPVISVASSGIKKILESEFIGEAVVKKLKEVGALRKETRIGILGTGSIGKAVEIALNRIGFEVSTYDPVTTRGNTKPANAINSIDVLLNKSDLIIGTVGVDSVVGTALERVSGEKVFASASSADVEFTSLLKIAEPSHEAFGTKTVKVHEDFVIKILNGGYPINFDRIKDSTPDEDIVLTRCLLYIGAMQAATLLSENKLEPIIYNLDKISQTHLLERWLEYKKELEQGVHIENKNIHEIVAFSSLGSAPDGPAVWKE